MCGRLLADCFRYYSGAVLNKGSRGKDAKTRANYRFVIVKRPIGDAYAGIEIAHVILSQARRQTPLAIQFHIRARQRHVTVRQAAGIERLEKCGRCSKSIRKGVVDEDGIGPRIEIRLNSTLVYEGREKLPAQAGIDC